MVALVKLPNGGLLSNKPPTDPVDPAICKSELKFSDGRVIWRSFPKPDRIVIVGYLMPHHFKGALGIPSLGGAVWELAQSLADATGNGDGASKHLNPQGKKMGVFKMPLGPRDAVVLVEVIKEKVKGEVLPHFRLRLEFNPRKLQPVGHEMLCWTFEQVEPAFDFPGFLADAQLKRFDVAVDYVGLRPSEVLATTKSPGKRVDYFGDDGTLESFQLHRKRKLPTKPQKSISNPCGMLALRVYDRDRERSAHGKPPPVAGYPTLRAETVCRRLIGFGLADLYDAAPFHNVALSYLPSCSPFLVSSRWLSYCACRRAAGHKEAAQVLGLGYFDAERADDAFRKHLNTLASDLTVTDWQKGVDETGLGLLVQLAATNVATGPLSEVAVPTSVTPEPAFGPPL